MEKEEILEYLVDAEWIRKLILPVLANKLARIERFYRYDNDDLYDKPEITRDYFEDKGIVLWTSQREINIKEQWSTWNEVVLFETGLFANIEYIETKTLCRTSFHTFADMTDRDAHMEPLDIEANKDRIAEVLSKYISEKVDKDNGRTERRKRDV